MSSAKQYQVDFYKGDSLIISEQEHAAIKQRLGTMSLFEVRGRIINASNIANIQECRNFEEENKWTPPQTELFDNTKPGYKKFLEMKEELLRKKRL